LLECAYDKAHQTKNSPGGRYTSRFTNFDEWTARFPDVIDVEAYRTRLVERSKDTVFVKFAPRNWVNNDTEVHYYEGIWQTVLEDGKYKMLKSQIKEAVDPDCSWFL